MYQQPEEQDTDYTLFADGTMLIKVNGTVERRKYVYNANLPGPAVSCIQPETKEGEMVVRSVDGRIWIVGTAPQPQPVTLQEVHDALVAQDTRFTVGKLRELLSQYPDDMEVLYCLHSDYDAMSADDIQVVKAVDSGGGWYMRSHKSMSNANKAKEKDYLLFPGN